MRFLVIPIAILFGFGAAHLGGFDGPASTPAAAAEVVEGYHSDAPHESAAEDKAAEAYRRDGYAGLNRYLESVSEELLDSKNGSARRILDRICAQRHCHASRLFWHTDLESAMQTAEREDKPIISLHLLGELTDERSCANSRFFRTLLYADPAVADLLREHFVLHWRTVRAVPQVEIDFGGGRVLRTTIAGNSVHHILDKKGRPVDALPGLFTPREFLSQLTAASASAKKSGGAGGANRRMLVRRYHQERLNALDERWQLIRMQLKMQDRVFRKLGNSDRTAGSRSESMWIPKEPPGLQPADRGIYGSPTAEEASYRALSKANIERPMLPAGTKPYKALRLAQEEALWHSISALSGYVAAISPEARALIIEESGQAAPGFYRMYAIPNFAQSLLVDSLRNTFQLHRAVHQWFIEQPDQGALPEFNEKIYSELFLTPSEDQWLGLNPGLTYTGLPNNGVFEHALPDSESSSQHAKVRSPVDTIP